MGYYPKTNSHFLYYNREPKFFFHLFEFFARILATHTRCAYAVLGEWSFTTGWALRFLLFRVIIILCIALNLNSIDHK